MMPNIVVDVGNSRMKWGRVEAHAVTVTAALPLDDVVAWGEMLAAWHLPASSQWVLAGSQPDARDRFTQWLITQYQHPLILDDHRHLPLRVQVDAPERVGFDRLLNAVGIGDRTAIIIDAGTAITVDFVEAGTFHGGAILPGLRLMGRTLHDYTARLPLVEFQGQPPLLPPAKNTHDAIGLGTTAMLTAGVRALIAGYRERAHWPVIVTGGDADYFADIDAQVEVQPHLTLEGIRRTMEILG